MFDHNLSCVRRKVDDHFLRLVKLSPHSVGREEPVSSHRNILMGEMFDFFERRIAEAIKNVTLSLLYTKCEVEQFQTKTLSFLGNTYPS